MESGLGGCCKVRVPGQGLLVRQQWQWEVVRWRVYTEGRAQKFVRGQAGGVSERSEKI